MAYSTLKRFLRKENNRWAFQRALRALQDSEVFLKLSGLQFLLLYNVDEVLSTESDKSAGFKLSVESNHAIMFGFDPMALDWKPLYSFSAIHSNKYFWFSNSHIQCSLYTSSLGEREVMKASLCSSFFLPLLVSNPWGESLLAGYSIAFPFYVVLFNIQVI